MLFEVCLEGVDAVKVAAESGIKRVELCAALIEGGITPSIGTIQAARDAVDIDIMVMIRPRGGDFIYSEAELLAMEYSIAACRSIGVNGVVFGLLEPEGNVDEANTSRLIKAAGPLSVTFHRAFDVAKDAAKSLECLIALGVDRVLTSGQAATVPEGKELIKALVQQANGRIEILPGCGITPENVAEIIAFTGVKEFHATAFAQQESKMQYRNEKVYMGIPGLPEYERKVTCGKEIQRYLKAIKTYL